jgi:hypothetical protein
MRKHSIKIVSLLSVLVMASMTMLASLGPEFLLSASPRSVGITWAQVAHYRLDIRSFEGFSGNVALACRASSPKVRCKILPEVVHVGGESATDTMASQEIHMMATAEPGAPIGRYTILVTGSALPISGGDSRGTSRTSVTLYVLPPTDPPNE